MAYYIDIDLRHINSIKSFYSLMHSKLKFPYYFAYNMDSLDECMLDLSWIENNTEIRFHNLDNIKTNYPVVYRKIKHALESFQNQWKSGIPYLPKHNIKISIV